ncbi:hypothetical protein [Novosphingobium lentum]|uniref:hypothetical protein n=1 Tax=Novosphingobium lentum TaxID=145287 RepID=UPI00083387B8|nr:hypothetical protein [Novosphingobium lentum]
MSTYSTAILPTVGSLAVALPLLRVREPTAKPVCLNAQSQDDLAVVDSSGALLGILTEKYVRRRYADEADRALRELYGEE